LSAGAPPQTSLRELTALPQIPWLDFRGPTSKGRGRDERERGGEGKVGKGISVLRHLKIGGTG